MEENRVLAMYDVRGIQEYIFRTAKVKDAIGASKIVEDIIDEAMKKAVNNLKKTNSLITSDLDWYDENGVRAYSAEEEKDIQVLYIGGGNAFFTFQDEELCIKVNQYMSKYVIQKTYSLQLAISIVECSGDYKEDYEKIFKEMNQVKEHMILSRPLGALPIMKRDIKTGYPIHYNQIDDTELETTETSHKKSEERNAREDIRTEEKIFDNYTTEKGLDSTLAVVHIDGNNMGLRIRSQIEGITDYNEAVMTMRRISYRINYAYKKVFDQMKGHFDQEGKSRDGRENSVLKILVAGDDITYVCNGKNAIDTVEYFAKEIVRYTMDGKKKDMVNDSDYDYPLEKETDEKKLASLGFSVCAGIAYINSHFPFYAGYEVAEACCESAKDRAKQDCYKGYSTKDHSGKRNRVGNWVDFQICKNIQAQNLKDMRRKEYWTSHGEKLMLRPYFIQTDTDFEMDKTVEQEITLGDFKNAVLHFQNSRKIPKTFAKQLRNTYSQGSFRMELLYNFLKSRDWKLPDGQEGLYIEDCKTGGKTARWYDALEMSDYYLISGGAGQTEAGEKDE